MAKSQLKLQESLEEFMGNDHVYFQPPESIKMVYPCIVYMLDDVDVRFADNKPYTMTDRYSVRIIDPNPDSKLRYEFLVKFPYASFGTHYTSKNLHHWTFNLYW